MKVLVIYVGQRGQDNYRHALENRIWGFNADARPAEQIVPGDLVLFGSGYTGGNIRAPHEMWLQRSITNLVVARISTSLSDSETTLEWPDEKRAGHVKYPYRFHFDILRQKAGEFKLNDPSILPQAVILAMRTSAIANRSSVVEVPHLPLLDEPGTAALAETAIEAHAETQVRQYLEAFKQEAAAWFAKARFVQEYFEFFRTFFKRENLEKIEWPDIQKVGSHLHCFQSMALAKGRALGKPNHPIEHYRKSFIYLAHGPGEPAERIHRFSNDTEYRLDYFGKSAVSELVGYLFPDEFMFVNARDKFAAEFLGIKVQKQSGEDLVAELQAFNKATRPVAKQYQEIVGRQTDLPLNLELDQFFSWLFENNEIKTSKNPAPALGFKIGADEKPVSVKNPDYPLSQCAFESGFAEELLRQWVRGIHRKGQAIVYGAPGTGKTFIAEKLARNLIGGDDGFFDIVQFHPAYAYEDFIQGIRPQTGSGGGLTYPLVSGRFLEFCKKAESRHGVCVLIIDEINRANLARVFGELMHLLEYRKRKMMLAGGTPFQIPENVRLIGTMNTADRSIALVDHALRRRFAFIPLSPQYAVIEKFHQTTGFAPAGLIQVLKSLNSLINDKHYHVGISFFLRPDLKNEIGDIWELEIEPYLEEFFFDQQDKLESFRWEKIKQKVLA